MQTIQLSPVGSGGRAVPGGGQRPQVDARALSEAPTSGPACSSSTATASSASASRNPGGAADGVGTENRSCTPSLLTSFHRPPPDHADEPELEDHCICHSLYLRDPDGYQVEITTYDVP